MTDEEFSTFWTFLVDKKFRKQAALTDDERIFYAANLFRGSVPRSGVLGYFENNTCDEIRDAHHALQVLVLAGPLRLLQQAQHIVLRGEPLPDSDEFVTLYDEDLSEEEYAEAMDELDEKVADIQEQILTHYQPIFEALCRFADERNLTVDNS